MYYLLVFTSVALISIGIILLKNPFFAFAYTTSQLLNIMLESRMEEFEKRKKHIKTLGTLLVKFGLLLLLMAVVLGISLLPLVVYARTQKLSAAELDMSSFYFILSMILGSVVLLLFPATRKRKSDYSDWSKLLHRMVLDHYNISRALFMLEKKLFRKKSELRNNTFVIVTGLARGGTTALTNLLFASGRFHSLSYNNMPFLLSVNTWRKIYRPRKSRLKERAHGDNIQFGYDTIEALEEYFFKTSLSDSFISGEKLKQHAIDQSIYDDYMQYQSLIRQKDNSSVYLAKNNNLILRYESLREFNPEFYVFLIFRSPRTHAYSLLNQHKKFSRLQEEEPFSLEYMNWLGHHEFGLNHKVFDLRLADEKDQFDKNSLNYWIAIWISYYTYVLTMIHERNMLLVDYQDLCKRPNELLTLLGEILDMDLSGTEKQPYSERELPELDLDPTLLDRSLKLYKKLQEHKIEVTSASQ